MGVSSWEASPFQTNSSNLGGMRLDGSALWAIRKNGWMELGFREDYFAQALLRSGWFGPGNAACQAPIALKSGEARLISEAAFRYPAGSAELRTEIGEFHGTSLVIDGSRQKAPASSDRISICRPATTAAK